MEDWGEYGDQFCVCMRGEAEICLCVSVLESLFVLPDADQVFSLFSLKLVLVYFVLICSMPAFYRWTAALISAFLVWAGFFRSQFSAKLQLFFFFS